MADNADIISRMTVLEEFENAIKNEQDRLEISPAYPNYTGLGAKPPTKSYANINKVKVNNKEGLPKAFRLDSEGQPPEWMKSKPCFTCGTNGHTLHSCTINPDVCGIEGCKLKHTPKAHGNYKEAKAKSEKSEKQG